MANTRSAKKAVRHIARRTEINMNRRSRVRSFLRKVEEAIASGDQGAAAAALQAFDRVRWIAGGLGKEGGITMLAPHLGHVAKAYLIGHSARDFALEIGETPHEICETMERAVARAAEEAQPGETVLLAPAAASFDQFTDFEARGEAFSKAVQDVING